MDKQKFAEKLYSFFKKQDDSGRYADMPPEDSIAELEGYLSHSYRVRDTIQDIEEISDMFDFHDYYVDEVKPLLYGLRELLSELEAAERRRMVSDTGYEISNAIHIGDKEVIFAENKDATDGMCWFVGDYTENEILGQYADCQVSDDFLEAAQEFAGRITRQVTLFREEMSQTDKTCELFTAEHCHPHDYSRSIDGKIVAIKANIYRPEFRRGEMQIVLIDGGSGAKADPHGRTVYCYHLNDGKHSRFYRSDILGEVKLECIPRWAADKAAAIQAQKASRQPKPRDREER